MRGLEGKQIVLGVTGSIAAFKAADLASKLTQAGAQVYVVMTPEAGEFITPLTFRSLTHQPVTSQMFDPNSPFSLEHIALAQRAEVVVVAPATAHIIAKMALGLADDMVSLTVLATKAPVLLAPAMDAGMYENPATRENLSRLKARGFTIAGPAYGRLASGAEGWGRLEEMDRILGAIRWVLGRGGDLAGKKVVVTAGGTQEPLDPVRYLTNASSGKMGYALAEAARDRGAQVVLIAAPTALPEPAGVELVKVRTAQEMKEAVEQAVKGAQVLVMAAAVADYKPSQAQEQKIKKTARQLTLELERTPDILSEVKGDFLKVGFAAESQNLVENATQKLKTKKLDLMVANDITQPDSGFGADTNRVVLIDREGKVESLPLLPKLEVAHRVLDRVGGYLSKFKTGGEMDLVNKFVSIGQSLTLETERAVGDKVIFEPAGRTKKHIEKNRQHGSYHYKAPNGHPRVFAWSTVMTRGPREIEPKRPCLGVVIIGNLVNRDDPIIARLRWNEDANFRSAEKGGGGEVKGIIYEVNDGGYRDVLFGLIMAAKACLK